MSTPAQIATALAGKVDDVTGLRVVEYVTEDVNPPMAILSLGEIDYVLAMQEGTVLIPFDVVVFVAKASERVAQSKLYAFAAPTGTSSTSVQAAIMADSHLGLSDVDCIVRSYRPLGLEEVAAYGYYGGVFKVDCITTGI